jgi:hypothetical protein
MRDAVRQPMSPWLIAPSRQAKSLLNQRRDGALCGGDWLQNAGSRIGNHGTHDGHALLLNGEPA